MSFRHDQTRKQIIPTDYSLLPAPDSQAIKSKIKMIAMSGEYTLGNISPLIPAGDDLESAIAFYEQNLGFQKVHQEGNPIHMAIVERDQAKIFLIKNSDSQLAQSTSLRIYVKNIENYYQELITKSAEIIHPQGKLETKPWGMREFVVLDSAGVCLTFYEPAGG